MQAEEYENIFKQEEAHWWYRSMRDLVCRILKRFAMLKDSSAIILDAGCGTGGTLRSLKKKFPRLILIGIDYSPIALNYCRNGFSLLRASVDSLPFDKESIDAVVCLDVLYHLNVSNDLKALREMNRILKRGGYVFIHLPAFEFLRGRHDKVVLTRERYTIEKLRGRMQGAGFKIIRCSYRHMFLFPFIYGKRIMENRFFKGAEGSDLKPLPSLLNNVLKFVSYSENRMLEYFNLPFGSSVLCLARKS
jgi:ubiquinone/menaquinone biosynthesis C-methylase UbiE